MWSIDRGSEGEDDRFQTRDVFIDILIICIYGCIKKKGSLLSCNNVSSPPIVAFQGGRELPDLFQDVAHHHHHPSPQIQNPHQHQQHHQHPHQESPPHPSFFRYATYTNMKYAQEEVGIYEKSRKEMENSN